MKKRKLRTLEELYGVSEEVSEPKITPVLKGGCRIQGPADEAEPVIHMTMGSCGAKKGFDGHFSSGKLYTSTESGTCNVCATPCSSCMHFDRVASLVKNMTDFSDEGYEEKIASRCCFNDAEFLSPCKSTASYDHQHISTETSNLLSRCSSHDSFSENAESKVALRASHASEDIEMGQTVLEDGCLPNPSTFNSNIIYSNEHRNQKDLECPGDDISCISRADGPISDRNGEGDRKNASYSSASVNSSPIGVTITNMEWTSHCLVSSRCGEELDHKPEFATESITKMDGLSKKLDTSESSSLRGGFAGPASPKREPSECSGEQVESSLERAATSSLAGQIPGKKEHSEKCSALLETSSMQKCLLQSQLIDDNAVSDVLEYEVKVCDICGDTGREELLATCTKCSDGAEHIYCMRIKLKKVPGLDWMCEECMAKEKTQIEMKGTIGFLKEPSLCQTSKNSRNSSASNFLNCLEVESTDSTVPKSRKKSLNSAISQFSAKRPADCPETGPVRKRMTLETITRSTKVPSSRKNDIRSWASSFKNLYKGNVKQAHGTSSLGDRATNKTWENARLPTSGHSSLKIRQQPQMSRASLSKSNSFHILGSNLKGKQPEKGVLQKQKFTRGTDTNDTKKGTGRMMNKSFSFNDAGSKHLNVVPSKIKMISPQFSHVEDLKRSHHAKWSSLQTNHKCKSNNTLNVSPVAGSGHPAPATGKRISSHGGTVSTRYSGITCNEMKFTQLQRYTDDSSEPTCQLALKDIKCSYHQGISGAKRSALCLSDVDTDPSPRMSDSSHETKLNRSIREVAFTRSSSLTNDRQNCNPGGFLQGHSSLIGKFSNQAKKTRITCSFSQPRKIPAGSRSAHCHRCKGIGHSTESCPTMNSQVPIKDTRNLKEVNQNGNIGDAVKTAIVGRDDLHITSTFPNQSSELSISNANMSCKVSSSDYLSQSSTCVGNPFSADETDDQQVRVKDVRKHAEDNTLTEYMIKVENSNSSVPSRERLYVRDVPRFSRISAIPQPDYMWKGGFEVHRIGRLSSYHSVIQAHLSTCASLKVLEVMHVLPPKIILEEVPRLSTWPAQFQENNATEDDIALYFFAADTESYSKNYRSLVECMIKNDLALKGNLEGVELLIFSSKLLPEKSQRWNALSYLWGVFKVRKMNFSEPVPPAHMHISIPCLNVLPSERDLSSTNSGQSFQSLSATKAAPHELQLISSGRIRSSDQRSTGVHTISCSTVPKEQEQLSNDMLQSNFSLNEHRDGERRVEVDPKLCLQERGEHKNAGMIVEEKAERERGQSYFCGIHEHHNTRDKNHSDDGVNDPQCCFSVEDQRCQGVQIIEITKKSRIMGAVASASCDFSLGIKFSQQQVSSIDEDQTKSGYPNLELSLGPENNSEKQGMVSSYLGIVKRKNNQDKHPNPASNRKNSVEEPSLSLSLGLSLGDV